jgi:hypothetical protein
VAVGTAEGVGSRLLALSNTVMTDEKESLSNSVDRSVNGPYHAYWHGRMVYENGRVKQFRTESEAWAFLARCDEVGKIIH